MKRQILILIVLCSVFFWVGSAAAATISGTVSYLGGGAPPESIVVSLNDAQCGGTCIASDDPDQQPDTMKSKCPLGPITYTSGSTTILHIIRPISGQVLRGKGRFVAKMQPSCLGCIKFSHYHRFSIAVRWHPFRHGL